VFVDLLNPEPPPGINATFGNPSFYNFGLIAPVSGKYVYPAQQINYKKSVFYFDQCRANGVWFLLKPRVRCSFKIHPYANQLPVTVGPGGQTLPVSNTWYDRGYPFPHA
jgi:hypothetical protein